MIVLINCGGSGSRLWPLSTPDYPKHLLKVEGGDGNGSLLQNTYYRVKDFADEVYFITEAGHAHHVKEQLNDVDDEHIIIEPARRGTASCIVYALDHIREKHDNDVPLVFIMADHVIHDHEAFREALDHAAKTSAEHKGITLFGVEPTYPSTGFGYIEKGSRVSDDNEKDVHEVSSFKEKPDRKTAEKYIREGRYYWNSGNFAAPLNVWVETMKNDSPNLHNSYCSLRDSSGRDEKQDSYLKFENNSIDYALMEPAKKLLVVPGTFDWVDIGSYQDLHTVSEQNDDGNAVQGDKIATVDMTNSFVRNDTDTKLAVIGLDNVAVVVTKEGIVVTNRNMAQKVKDAAEKLKENK